MADDIAIYSEGKNEIGRIVSLLDVENWCYSEGFLWLKKQDGKLLKVGGDGDEGFQCELFAKVSSRSGDWVVGVVSKSWREKYLASKNLVTNEYHQLKGKFISAVTDGKSLFSTEMDELCGFSLDLKEKWRVEMFANHSNQLFNVSNLGALYLFENLLILNVGLENGSKTGSIVAIEKESGEEKWRYEYQGEPQHSFFKGGKYYLVIDGEIIILNAADGMCVDIVKPSLGCEIVLFPMSDKIIIGSNLNRSITYYSITEKKLSSEALLPKGYVFNLSSLPSEINGKIYFCVHLDHPTLKFGRGGLLSIPLMKNLNEIVSVEELLPMPMMVVADGKSEKVYVFTVSCDSLDDLRRLGSITLTEYAYTYGEPAHIPLMSPDKKHKGKIKVVVDGSLLPDDAEPQLKTWAAELSEHFYKMAMFPGAGQKYRFSIEIEMA